MFPYRLFPFSFALIALAPFSAADTLTVGPAGSGAQFSQIQAAIDAAQDDDVILVQAGTYQAIVVDKPLRILGDGPGGVTISASGHCVIVRDIGAGEELVLSGAEIQGTDFLFDFLSPVLLEDCPGTVILHDLLVPEVYWATGMQVENCARAVLLDSHVSGLPFHPFFPNAGVIAQDSTLWIVNSEIRSVGGDLIASPGLGLTNSTLHAWRTSIRGGSLAGQLDFDGGGSNYGGHGILAVGFYSAARRLWSSVVREPPRSSSSPSPFRAETDSISPRTHTRRSKQISRSRAG